MLLDMSSYIVKFFFTNIEWIYVNVLQTGIYLWNKG